MKNLNVKIKEIAIYHPENLVTNEFYTEHFKKQGKDISQFLERFGKKERYIINTQDENTLSMGIEAAQRVLEKAQLEGKDIDMIVFSTQVPERTLPTNAMYVHDAIGAKNHTVIFDSNANCAGMTIAIENASRYMMSNPRINRALIIGSDANSLITNPEQEISYTNFSDGAAAVILEKTEEDTGFIDALFEVNSLNKDTIVYPQKGFSQTIGSKQHIVFSPFDSAVIVRTACKMIGNLLEQNGLTIDDIDACCFSQFSIQSTLRIQEQFKIEDEKIITVGDKYGYTSTSSPFFCLHEGVKDGRIKRGDTILFWTIGAGDEMVAMLFKY